ncbi:MAG: 3-hydroxyacyl-CoA dehydrogenase NAD-binding domain-containing protein [bacterium]|nr:3-hydroxyacyl-CoA dehydrogenase NAD-binding domain-containing protein [bacterium]
MSKFWKCSTDEEGNMVAELDLGPDEKQNLLRAEVLKELNVILSTNNPKCLIITTAKPHSFCAGADVGEINALANGKQEHLVAALESMHALLLKIRNSSYPIVAATSGECLGGGTELVLACHKRIAARHPKTRFGLPEVMLGVIPGFGGTQLLPKLVGVRKAMEVIVGQRKLSADDALKCGLVDKVVIPELLIVEAKKIAFEETERKKLSWVDRIGAVRDFVMRMAKKQTLKATKGVYPAPMKAIEAIDFSDANLEDGLAREGQLFLECAATMESASLRDIFLKQREAKSKDWIGVNPPSAHSGGGGTPPEKVLMLGAGVMGRAIAYAVLAGGVRVNLHDMSSKAIHEAVLFIEGQLAKEVKKSKLSLEKAQGMRDRLIVSYGDEPTIDGVDFVIEAIVEDLTIKPRVLAELEKKLPENAVIATNTSSLLPSDIAAPLTRKDKFCAMHFFNPAHKMDLVEIVGTAETSKETLAKTLALIKAMGKTPILLDKECAGLLVNRVLVRGMAKALDCLLSGEDPWEIDMALEGAGMVMGPFKTIDLVGFDIAYHVMKMMGHYYPEIYGKTEVGNLELHKFKDILGQKTGKGFYVWENNKAVKPNKEILKKFGWELFPHDKEIGALDCCHLIRKEMNEEAMALVSERICSDPNMIDLSLVLGAGLFPNRRGLLKNPII